MGSHLLHESHARVTRTLSPFRLRFLVTCRVLAAGAGRYWLSEAIRVRLPLPRVVGWTYLLEELSSRMCLARPGNERRDPSLT